MDKILLIDGNSLLFRAYYATSYGNMMQSKNGVYTNAIVVFANMLNKVIESVNPKYALVAFDTDKKTFRHKEFDFYKATRKETPEELVCQFPLAREMATKMGIKVYEKEGYEADDIVATLARHANKKGIKAAIFSSDKDLLQLVNENTTIHLIKKGISDIEEVTPSYLFNNYNLKPYQVIEYKGLRGDPSDNIPGVKGVGEKTALKLLNEYDTIEKLYDNIDKIDGKLKDKLLEGKESAFVSKRIATIYDDVPLDFDVKELVYKGPSEELLTFYQEYDMFSLAKKLSIKKEEPFTYQVKKDLPKSFLSKDISIFAYYEGTNYHLNPFKGIAFSNRKENYYVSKEDILNSDNIKEYLGSETPKYTYDTKAIRYMLNVLNIKANGFNFDVKIAAYLIDCTLKDDLYSLFANFGITLIKNKDNDEEYSCFVANKMLEIKDILISKMKERNVYKLFFEMEMPLVDCLLEMEINGIKVNKEILENLGVEYRFKLNSIESNIFELVGHSFNVASPKQVGEVLFDELHLPANRKRSTSSEELEKLSKYHEVPGLILQYRKYAKLLSTYVDGLLNYVTSDNKIHAIFNQTQTQTGRLSSSEPNMQNISVRDEESRLIRKAFIPSTSNGKILSIDYSQVELRVLASISNDETMINSFKNNEDIHLKTAMAIFDLPKEMITSKMRRQAKAINFGIIYGISDWGLSEQIDMPPKEAKKFIEKYFITFPKVKEYLDNIVNECKEKGYVTTLFNRRRDVKEINNSSYMVREFGKRVAMNTPIQGTAADIMKIAMNNIHKYLKENNYKSKLVIQIHDELVFDMVEDEIEELTPILKRIMEEATNLKVKLVADVGIGNTWFEAK